MEYDDGDVAQVDLMEFGWAGGDRWWTRVHELWGSIFCSTTAYSHSVHWFYFHCHTCSSSPCSSRRHEITFGATGHMKAVKNGIFSIKRRSLLWYGLSSYCLEKVPWKR
ncbi:hypothetical protein VPH35_127460 [Triticum aestivum]